MEASKDENDDYSDASVTQDEVGSDDDGDRQARRRLSWTKIWKSTSSDAMKVFRESLPSNSTTKSDEIRCTIDHAFDKDYDLVCFVHTMRSRRAKCTSKRCCVQYDDDNTAADTDEKCPARYRFNSCLSSGASEVFAQGEHFMDNDGSSSPVQQKLNYQMKAFITEKLNSGHKTTAAKLFAAISAMVGSKDMSGPPPKDQQVVNFVKNWRRDNPTNAMGPMIELCDGHLYEQQDVAALSDREMVILCDSQPDARPGSTGRVSHLGDGSVAFPFRVGMTCVLQIKDYVAVQGRSDCTTILHVDSTHSMAIHGYVVYAFGYSDQSCHFLPLAYFCTSQKGKIDIGWCIRWIKCLCIDLCGVEFSPDFVMTDGDKAHLTPVSWTFLLPQFSCVGSI